jgi:hypothetical protein
MWVLTFRRENKVIRKFKMLSLAMVAVLALGAIGAQAASAAFNFTAPGAGASQVIELTGTKITNHVFKNAGGEVTCSTISFSGSATGPEQTQQTSIPSYSGCSAFGFAEAHVKMNGCDYLFTAPTTEPEAGKYTGEPPHFICPVVGGVKQKAEITPTFFGASVCTQFIPEQTPTGGHVIYSNSGTAGTGMDVVVKSATTGIHYTGTGSSCGNSETHSDGEYTGETTLRGYSNAAHTIQFGITVN